MSLPKEDGLVKNLSNSISNDGMLGQSALSFASNTTSNGLIVEVKLWQ